MGHPPRRFGSPMSQDLEILPYSQGGLRGVVEGIVVESGRGDMGSQQVSQSSVVHSLNPPAAFL